MEVLGPNDSADKFREKLKRIREYLNSLSVKRNRTKRKKVEDDINEQIEEVFDKDSSEKQEDSFSDKWNQWEDEREDGWEESDNDWEENSENNGWDNNSWDSDTEEWDDEWDEEWNQWSQSWNGWWNWWKQWKSSKSKSKENKSEFETPPEDRDEYIPQDSEIWEAMGEQSRFAEIYPAFLWYYAQWKKSYFNRETNLWSKRKTLSQLTHKLPEWTKKYAYTWVITKWINAIPLPDLAWPDTSTLHSTWKSAPEFHVDQNGCVYLVSNEKQFVSFNFWLNQHDNTKAPVSADSDKIIFDSLSQDTQELLDNLRSSWANPQQIAAAIKYYIIKNKKYSTKVQWTLRNKSNRDTYIKHLDESPILECFSANSLFVALCRQLWVPARLVVGHMVQSSNKEWKACLTKNDWHAWSEIWDASLWSWLRVDATPTEKEDWEKSNENGQEENDNQNNNQNADNNFWDNQSQSWDKSDKKSNSNSENNSKESSQSWESQDGKSESNSENTWEKKNSDSEKWDEWSKNSDAQNTWDWESTDNASQSENASDSQDNDSQSNQSEQDQKWKKTWDEKESKQQWNWKGQLIDESDAKPTKSPSELLDEMIEKAKEDDLMKQSEELNEVLDKLDKANSKEDIKNILDESKLSDFAKDMVDKIWKDKILEDERKDLEKLDDESKIDEALKNSLLDEEYKQKLKEYAKRMKDKIAEEKRKMKSEMEKLWFTEKELAYYKEYKELEAEVEPEVRKQIKELQKILPVQYQILRNENDIYRSGPQIDWWKLVEFAITWDPLIFRRNHEVRESNEINMFETIIIDTSWSMWRIDYPWSILRESVKAAIIRAKVLEHFKVDFSIVLFWDRVDEVMSFWEKFSSKKKCSIPAKLMRSAHISWWNSREPISYVYENMLKQSRKTRWKSFWNISFIWDGDLYNWSRRQDLKAMIDDLKKRWFWVTAYYINDSWSNLIGYYFGSPSDWWAVYAWSSKELSKEIVESHKTHLKKKIRKYMK